MRWVGDSTMTVSAIMSSWVGCWDRMMAAAVVGTLVTDERAARGAVTTAPTTVVATVGRLRPTAGKPSGSAPAIYDQ